MQKQMKLLINLAILCVLGTLALAITVTVHPAQSQYAPGQELRVAVDFGAFVDTVVLEGAAIVIIRAPKLCNASIGADEGIESTTWEFADDGPTTVAFCTITTPPYPFHLCYRWSDGKRRDPNPYGSRNVLLVNATTRYTLTAPQTMVDGDYASFLIESAFISYSSRTGVDGDSIKFVPTGHSCSTLRCGGRAVNHTTGFWHRSGCVGELAAGKVGAVGSIRYNPLSRRETVPHVVSSQPLAFIVLPQPGDYDVCFSPLRFRQRFARSDASMWFKLRCAGANCATPSLRVLERGQVEPIRWRADDETPGTWGTLIFTGSGLSSMPQAAAAPEDDLYFNITMGGDSVRLVEAEGSTAGCWDEAADVEGETLSTNLGAPPRSGPSAHLADDVAQTSVAAYLRFPVGRRFVCYRKAGISNWRIVDHATRENSQLTGVANPIHYAITHSLPDVREGTWAELRLAATSALFALTPSNFHTTAPTVRSTALRIIDGVEWSCDTPAASSVATESWDPGSPTCTPDVCGFSMNCGAGRCLGRLDNAPELKSDAAFFFRIPAGGTVYRVCVRVGTLNWRQLMLLSPAAAPALFASVTDERIGARSAILVRGDALDATASSSSGGGDAMRIVPNSATCDLTWQLGNPQSYAAANTVTDLGAFCLESQEAAFPALCNGTRRDPVSGEVRGMSPNVGFVLDADGALPPTIAAAAWFSLVPGPLKVCYRQQLLNWIEVDVPLAPRHGGLACTASISANDAVAGALAPINVTCDTEANATAIAAVKVVSAAAGCEVPPAGLIIEDARFASSTLSSGETAVAIAADHPARATALLIMPFSASRIAVGVYRVCVIDALLPNTSWFSAGTIEVRDVQLTAVADPATDFVHQQTIELRIQATSASIDTRAGHSAAKLVSLQEPCADSAAHMSWVEEELRTDSLRPPDTEFSPWVALTITLPPTTAKRACYAVCFRDHSSPWIAVPFAGFGQLCATAPRVTVLSVRRDMLLPRTTATSTEVLGGASTFWDFVVASEFTMDTQLDHTSDVAFTVLPDAAHVDLDNDRFMLVEGPHCTGHVSDSGAAIAPTDSGELLFDLPLIPGAYVPCYRLGADDQRWIKLQLAAVESGSRLAHTLHVHPTLIDTTPAAGRQLIVEETRVEILEGRIASMAALSVSDVVYIANASGVCGRSPAFDGRSILTAATALSVGEGLASVIRNTAAAVVPELPGRFKVCYFRTSGERVNGSASVASPVPRNRWFHVSFRDEPFLATQPPPTHLRLQCGSSSTFASGELIRLQLSFFRSPNQEDPVAPTPHAVITVHGAGFNFTTSIDGCSAAAPSVFVTSRPVTAMDILPLTKCNGSNCSVWVSATLGDSAIPLRSAVCSFDVVRANTSRVAVVSSPSLCPIGARCTVRMSVTEGGGLPLYSTNDHVGAVMEDQAAFPGLTLAFEPLHPTLLGGFTELAVVPMLNETSAALWVKDVYAARVRITSGAATTLLTVSIPRPAVTALRIVDVRAVSSSAGEWMPAVPRDLVALDSATLRGAHLVTAHEYQVHLLAFDVYNRSVHPAFLAQESVSVQLLVNDTVNKLLTPGGPQDEAALAPLFPATTAEMAVSFRVKHASECQPSVGGCDIVFSITSGPSTVLRTVVRSPATQLRVRCSTNGGQSFTNDHCQGTTSVERGILLEVEAIDFFNVVDELYEGTLVAVARSDGTVVPPAAVALGELLGGDPRRPETPIVHGRAVWALTLSRPCPSGCTIIIAGNGGGATAATVRLSVTPSTTSLKCRLNTRLFRADTGGSAVPLVAGETHPESLIYSDTELCFTIEAVNANGSSTKYETLWVFYHVASDTGIPVITRDTQQGRPRVQRLVRSTTEFCFVATTPDAAAQMTVTFGVQRFGGEHWTSGAEASCSIGDLRLVRQKVPARLVFSEATGDFAELPTAEFQAPTQTLWLWAQHAPPASQALHVSAQLEVTAGFIDHYGRQLDFAAVESSPRLTEAHVLPHGCAAHAESSPPLSCSTVAASPEHRPEESGVLLLAPLEATTAARGIPRFRFTVRGFCLRCVLNFTVVNVSGDPVADAAFGTMSATLALTWLLPSSSPRQVALRHLTSPLRHVPHTSAPVPAEDELLIAACDRRNAAQETAISTTSAPAEVIVLSAAGDTTGTVDARGEPQCRNGAPCTLQTIVAQLDVMTDVEVGLSIGNQLLQCQESVARCDGNNTPKVRQWLMQQSGRTPVEAVLSLRYTTLPSAKFAVKGLLPSYPHDVNATRTAPPSIGGRLRVVAVVNTTVAPVADFVSTGSIYWRGPRYPSGIRFLEAARDAACVNTPTYPSSLGAQHGGYLSHRTVDELHFGYAADSGVMLRPGVPFPITVELHDEWNATVALSEGEVEISKRVRRRCGGTAGGTLDVQGGARQSLLLGRATFWVTFSEPCDAYELQARLYPASSPPFRRMAPLSATHLAFSRVLKVQRADENLSPQLVVASTLIASELAVGTPIPVSLRAISTVGESIPFDVHPEFASEQRVFIFSQTYTTHTGLTVGNGGVLRRTGSSGAPFSRRERVALTIKGSADVSVTFDRTCARCSVWVHREQDRDSFALRTATGSTLLHITAPFVHPVVIGHVPRTVRRGTTFSVTVALAAANAAGIGGEAREADAQTAVNPGPVINGDGGIVTTDYLRLGGAVVVLVEASDSCGACRLRVGAPSAPAYEGLLVVTSPATHLRIRSIVPNQVAPGSGSVVVTMYASDDRGFVDQTAGGPTDCRLYPAFACRVALLTSPAISVVPSTSGRTPLGFRPTLPHFHAGGADSAFAIVMVDNRLADGTAQLRMNFTSPVRSLVPLFSADTLQISSAGRLDPSNPGHVIDVVLSDLQNVRLAVRQQQLAFNSIQQLELEVGIVKATGAGGTQYVVAAAENEITATFSGGCAGRPMRRIAAAKGLAVLRERYDPTPTGNPCRVTFTLVPRDDGISCTADTVACTTVVDITVTAPPIAGWTWMRPMPEENGDTIGGPLFAASGRRQFVSAAAVVRLGGELLPAPGCPGCELRIDSSACAATAAPEHPAYAPFTNGRASVVLRWPAAASRYSCELRASATMGTSDLPFVAGLQSGAAWQGVVSVCVPHHLHVVTNISSLTNGTGELPTGRPLHVVVEMRERDGARCRGDTQEDATRVTVGVPVVERTSAIIVAALNVNPAVSSAMRDERSWAVNNEVQLIAGRYDFQLVLTATARQALVESVRLRFIARSSSPPLDQVVHTGLFVPVVAASRLRVRPDTLPPRYAVATRFASPRNLVLEAVDGVVEEWLRFAPNAPNVARRAGEHGNNAEVEWVVEPLPLLQPFPLDFSEGSRIVRLREGTSMARFNFTGAAGTYTIRAVDRSTGANQLAASLPMTITVQSPHSLGIRRNASAAVAAAAAAPFCAPPMERCNLTRAGVFNDSALAATGLLHTEQEAFFRITVAVLDAHGAPLHGDTTSVLGLRLIRRHSSSTVRLRQCLSASVCGDGPFTATVVGGTATFDVVFSGTTHISAAQHDPVQLEAFCPRLPDRLNPCLVWELQPLRTNAIVVLDHRVPEDVTAIIAAHMPRLRVPLTVTSLAQLSAPALRRAIHASLMSFPASQWPTTANSEDRVVIFACEVNAAVFDGSDGLQAHVCGRTTMCQSPFDFGCPAGVRLCLCPTPLTAAGREFQQQQQQPPAAPATISVVAEVTFALFPADVAGANVPALLAAVGFHVLHQLRTNTSVGINIDRSRVALLVDSSAPTETATTAGDGVAPTPAPPSTTSAPAPPTGPVGSSGTASPRLRAALWYTFAGTLLVFLSSFF